MIALNLTADHAKTAQTLLRAILWFCIAVAHAGILMMLARARPPDLPVYRIPMEVRMITEVKPDAPPQIVPPVKKPKVIQKIKPPEKLPVPMIAAKPVEDVPPAPDEYIVPEIEPPPPVENIVVNEEPVIVAMPRFDADYLDNPAPEYPTLSKRLGEKGRVVLRVFVEANGRAGKIEIKQSSGYTRLDESARSAVYRWRFIPARQIIDGVPRDVGAWVAVPITFRVNG